MSEKIFVLAFGQLTQPFLLGEIGESSRQVKEDAIQELAASYPDTNYFFVKVVHEETTDVFEPDWHGFDLDRNSVTWLAEVPPHRREE